MDTAERVAKIRERAQSLVDQGELIYRRYQDRVQAVAPQAAQMLDGGKVMFSGARWLLSVDLAGVMATMPDPDAILTFWENQLSLMEANTRELVKRIEGYLS